MDNERFLIKVRKSPNIEFDERNGLLQLPKAMSFTVFLEEYKKELEDVESEYDRSYKIAVKKWNERVNKGWKLNRLKENWNANKKLRDEKMRNALDELKKKYSSVNWVWTLVGRRLLPQNLTHNNSFSKGYFGEKQINFPVVAEGGGLAYLEAFLPEYGAKGNPPFGIYVQAMGIPKVLDILWTDLNDNIIEETTEIAWYSKVRLHIYTEGLYGQELDIVLLDRDYASGDDKLPFVDNKFKFQCEVNIHNASKCDLKSNSVLSNLVDDNKKNVPHVQKAVVDVWIDHSWKEIAGNSISDYRLKIYPKINITASGKLLEVPKKFLNVHEKGKKIEAEQDYSNKPAVVGEVETNIAMFHPCGYESITITEDKRTFEIFNKHDHYNVKNPFEIVAGDRENTIKTILIKLDENASNSECNLEQRTGVSTTHIGNVFQIIKYPEKEISENSKQETKSVVKINIKEDKKIGYISTKSSTNYELGKNNKLKILKKDDFNLKFQARYIYNRTPILIGSFYIHYLYRYIWDFNEFRQYIVEVASCRYGKQLININVYPNLTWAIRIEYTSDGELKKKKELISNQTYKDTRRAIFKREPSKWIKIGERNLGLKLEVKEGDDDFVDLSFNIIELIKEKLKPIQELAELLTSIIDGKGANSKNLSDDQTARLEKSKRELAKFAKDENNRKKKLGELHGNFRNILKSRKNPTKHVPSLQRKQDKYLPELKRKILSMEIVYPDFGLEFEWKRVPIQKQEYKDLHNQTGIEINGQLEAAPIIGANVYLDFLALAQRAHPIALVAIAALDIATELIGNGSRIILEFSIKSQIDGRIKGFYNTATGENSFSTEDRKNNDKYLVELGGKIEFQILFAIHFKTEKRITNIFTGTNYVAELKVGTELKANAKFNGKLKFNIDDKGFYGIPSGSFDGISFSATIGVKGKIEKQDSEEELFSEDKEIELEFEAIAPKEEVELKPFYMI